jgi:hypothetical protein
MATTWMAKMMIILAKVVAVPTLTRKMAKMKMRVTKGIRETTHLVSAKMTTMMMERTKAWIVMPRSILLTFLLQPKPSNFPAAMVAA